MDGAEVNRQVEGAAAAHQRLLEALGGLDRAGLTDDMVGRRSRLPGWTVGHVLAHLAHNAEGLVNMFRGAEEGRVAEQYPGGLPARDAAIERDAGRSAAEHVDAIRASIYALEGAWNAAREGWSGRGRLGTGAVVPIADLPLRRWREVEVHMSDLGLAELGLDGVEVWSNDYIGHDLRRLTMLYKARGSMGLVDLPDAARTLEPRRRLAWLLGRAEVPGLDKAGVL
jgi:maleylpyruvate isomerase